MRNISQATYDRLRSKLGPHADGWRCSVAGQDARDLLEAYESLAHALDNLLSIAHGVASSPEAEAAADLLYREDGCLRVELDP